MPYPKPISEPIAVVGASCRFAGGVDSPSRLWELLASPKDLTKEVPSDRFNIHAFYHRDGEYHGTTNSPKAYFLEQNHRAFDAGFFNISPREAEAIDPQQRMLLEVVYEALEAAGYSLSQYAGEKVAVFAGLMTGDYDTLSQRDELDTSQYYATGNARSILSNRISYFFNFRGPSMTIDTACSSSLVALHQAVLSLRSGECKMACVAGANLILTPEQFIVESSLHMLSPSGHCRMWDAGADGYARGEGIAAMFIKPLSQALADGDHIEAIIRETGVNSDGRSRGITMPNWEAQSQLIRDTYQRAGLNSKDPQDRCQYFEAHGTGTSVGDPNEARAIEHAFFEPKKGTSPSRSKLLVGSVKTVIGHTEGAAGLAGLIKMIESMRNDTVPPNLHLEKLNPDVKQYCANLSVPTTAVRWPRVPTGQPKRGSVNSFGFGGTNAHAIVEQYIPQLHDPSPATTSRLNCPENNQVYLPLVLSAPSQKSLAAIVKTYRDYLKRNPKVNTQELAWHTFGRRTAFPFRLSVSSTSASGLNENSSAPTMGTRARSQQEPTKILGIFTGQGAQWATMSRGLFGASNIFAKVIRDLDVILQTCPDPPSWSLEQEILADKNLSRVKLASVSQPLCTAVQLALVELLRHLDVTFDAVVGHSSGEIAAAYAAGKISMRDAILISHYRGLGKGGMLAAGLSKEEATKFCEGQDNAPSSVTLSGNLDAQGKFARALFVDTAYHSPHMEDASVKYLETLRACHITPAKGNGTAWVSTVYGAGEPSQTELSCQYWKDNMAKPVLFCEAVGTALETLGPFDCAIEVGPHPALKGPVSQTMRATKGEVIAYSGVLDRTKDDREAFADFLGWMWTQLGLTSSQIRQFVLDSLQPELVHSRLSDAPLYPWDRSQMFYRESRISRQYHFKADKPHELLGVRTRDDNKHQLRWRNILKHDKLPWVKHHSFQGQALLPASAYLVMALDAARTALAGRRASVVELRNLKFMSGIILEPNAPGVEILFNLAIESDADGAVEASFTLTSAIADGTIDMKKNFSGNLTITVAQPSVDALPARPKDRAETLHDNPAAFYDMMARTGLVYTSPFKALQTLERRYNFSSGTLKKYHDEDTTSLSISPATLDSCLQTAFVTISSSGDNAIWTSFLPLDIDSVRFNLAICDIQNHKDDALAVDAYMTKATPITETTAASFTADIEIFNCQGEMEIQVQGLTVGSFSSTKPEEDYELYLTTKLDVDPDDEIVATGDIEIYATNPMLIKSCERVAALYTTTTHGSANRPRSSSTLSRASTSVQQEMEVPITAWFAETEESLDKFIRASPYFLALDFIRELGKNLPDVIAGMLPAVIDEAHSLVGFQQHVSRVVQQIAHKYPRMNVLGLTDPEMGLTERVLAGLKDSFASFRVGAEPEKNLQSRVMLNDSLRKRIMVDKLDLNATIDTQQGPQYDLVLLAASLIEPQKTATVLHKVNQMMRPGGFLVLVDVSRSPLKDRIRRCAGFASGEKSLLSPPDWPDVLDQCGFRYSPKGGHQYYPPGFSLIIRQAESAEKHALLNPLASPGQQQNLADRLLVVGGKHWRTALISSGVCSILERYCDTIDVAETLESLALASAASYSAAIFLNDLDEPVLATMTRARMAALRALFRPEMVILWVTHKARFDNPDHAASFGFARTLIAETPGLVLQMLDLDTHDTESTVEAITETFARLATHAALGTDDDEVKLLWINEPEVHLENGHRMVPRLLPWKEGNDRVNAPRRVVSNTINTLENLVQLVKVQSHDGTTKHEALYPPDGIWVIDMLPASSKLSKLLAQTLPTNCAYNDFASLVTPWTHSMGEERLEVSGLWKQALGFALSKIKTSHSSPKHAMMTVPELLRPGTVLPAFQLVDWKAERSISQIVKPLAGTRLLSPLKTYVLVGLTRDFGQSLRNPPITPPKWQTEMLSRGITVRFEALDVTMLGRVVAFKAKLAETLPPVGGVVNGAMVLEDRVFSQMSLETLQRVMKPKTIGSKNLDLVFDGPEMDFFILTSSFAAVGGHAGQSNYAAANMYMNGLAASRRRRGLPGSVLNIGVIYGLGFLHREKDDLYTGLEREGYPPISERDIHHMFVEAIVAGRAGVPGQIYDITTGLRRFRAEAPVLSWHHDPRFGHFTVNDEEDRWRAESGAGGTGRVNLKELVAGAETAETLVEVLVEAVVTHVQGQLQLTEGAVTGEHSFVELGVDSLAAVEIRAWVWKALGQDVAVMKILGGGTIERVCGEIAVGMLEAREKGCGKDDLKKEEDTGKLSSHSIATTLDSLAASSQQQWCPTCIRKTPTPRSCGSARHALALHKPGPAGQLDAPASETA
ncbi:hypothetical protein C8A05DRAFT_45692 [Staphylotrichum tortipilum]|uniref:Polyketide synthase n=1 Tax=Staphylotrichum tortipilum TaxID=2831512 RepID=A0AAN6RSG2_9PEZI|nr:hypothetical protein C8A05DRAFT_45692 [Staphylotrichum longicolle]